MGSSIRDQLKRLVVGDIMDRNAVTVGPDTTVEVSRDLLLEHGLSGVPVVRGTTLMGMVSKSDVLWKARENDWGETEWSIEGVDWVDDLSMHVEPRQPTVGEIMTMRLVTVPESATLARACALMAYEGIQQLPVTSNHDVTRLVGVLRALQVLRLVAQLEGFLMPEHSQIQRGRPTKSVGSVARTMGS